MDEPSILKFLDMMHIQYGRINYSGDWMNFSCPLAPWTHEKGHDTHPSFGIIINEKYHSKFKCLACNVKGTLPRLAALLGKYRKTDVSKEIHWAELTEIRGFGAKPLRDWDTVYDNSVLEVTKEFVPKQSLLYAYPNAYSHRYLHQRGIHWLTAAKLQIRYDAFQNRVLFPVIDYKGRFRGYTGRSTLSNKYLSKKNPKVRDYYGLQKQSLFLNHFSFQNTLLRSKGLGSIQLLVEGPFDFARMYSYGYINCRAVLGTSATTDKIKHLIDLGSPVFFLFDNDKAGIDAVFGTDEIKGWAPVLSKHIPVWVCEYPNNLDGSDPGSLTKEEATQAISNAKLYV